MAESTSEQMGYPALPHEQGNDLVESSELCRNPVTRTLRVLQKYRLFASTTRAVIFDEVDGKAWSQTGCAGLQVIGFYIMTLGALIDPSLPGLMKVK